MPLARLAGVDVEVRVMVAERVVPSEPEMSAQVEPLSEEYCHLSIHTEGFDVWLNTQVRLARASPPTALRLLGVSGTEPTGRPVAVAGWPQPMSFRARTLKV